MYYLVICLILRFDNYDSIKFYQFGYCMLCNDSQAFECILYTQCLFDIILVLGVNI